MFNFFGISIRTVCMCFFYSVREMFCLWGPWPICCLTYRSHPQVILSRDTAIQSDQLATSLQERKWEIQELDLCLTKDCAMKMCEALEGFLHAFLIFCRRRWWAVSFTPRPLFHPTKRSPQCLFVRNQRDPKFHLDEPRNGSELRSSGLLLAAIWNSSEN